MTLLFASDFHGREAAFRTFARSLAEGPYEGGLLGGDLLDEWLPEPELARLTGAALPAEDPALRLRWGLAARRDELRGLLEGAGKPIFFVLGNHDVVDWTDSALLTNLHGRSLDFGGVRLTGYRWTRMDRYPDELAEDLPALKAQVDGQTVLLTHSPPYGILDGLPGARFRFGLKGLLEVPEPRVHLFGHVHECAGIEGRRVNGSWPALRRFFAVDAATGQARILPPAFV